MSKKIYKNKNGYLSVKEFVQLIHTGEIDQFMRHHRVTDNPCPPEKLISSDQVCFYCVSCQRHCVSQVKEYKDYYLVKKDKFQKGDLNV